MNITDFIPYEFAVWQWFALVFCGICIGLAKTGINGASIVAIPILAFIFGARESTGIVLPILCFADLLAVIFYRRSAEWKYIWRLLPWALSGFVVAIFVDQIVPAEMFRILIGICIITGIAIMLWNDFKAKKSASTIPKKENSVVRYITQAGFGIVGGFSTMIGNAAGPVMSVFLLSMRLPKESFVGTAAWFFMIINYTKIPVQIFVWDNLSISGLKLALVLSPAVVAGSLLGLLLVKKISEKHYRRLVYVMTLLSTVLLFL